LFKGEGKGGGVGPKRRWSSEASFAIKKKRKNAKNRSFHQRRRQRKKKRPAYLFRGEKILGPPGSKKTTVLLGGGKEKRKGRRAETLVSLGARLRRGQGGERSPCFKKKKKVPAPFTNLTVRKAGHHGGGKGGGGKSPSGSVVRANGNGGALCEEEKDLGIRRGSRGTLVKGKRTPGDKKMGR